MSYKKLDDETLKGIKDNEKWYGKLKNEYEQFNSLMNQVYDYSLSDMTIKNPDGIVINVDKSIQHLIFYMMNNRKRELFCLLNDIDNVK